ncbi:MAG: alpha/beta hydrolase [Myxococcota bacterium]
MHEVRSLEVRGLPIVYDVYGPPTAPTLFCFHGFLDHAGVWPAVIQGLLPRMRVIAPDFRGHGRSGWIGAGGYYHFLDNIADAAMLVDAVGAERFSLLGHSMGGSIALGIAGLYAERVDAVVTLEGMGPPADEVEAAPRRLKQWIHALAQDNLRGDAAARRRARKPMPSVEEAAERIRRTNPRVSSARALEIAGYGTEPHEGGGVVWRFDPLHKTPGGRPYGLAEWFAHWSMVTAPVLSLYGGESEWMLSDLAARHQQLKSVRVGLVDGAGHNIHHDRPEVVASALEAWILGDRGALPAGVRPQ